MSASVSDALQNQVREFAKQKVYAIAKELAANLQEEEVTEHVKMPVTFSVQQTGEDSYSIVADVHTLSAYARRLFEEVYWPNIKKKGGVSSD